MKRPLAVAGFSVLVSLCVLSAVSSISFCLITAIVSYIAFLICSFIRYFRQRLTVPVICFCVFLACFMFYSQENEYQRLSAFAETDGEIVCTVREEPVYNETNSRYYCKAAVESLNGKEYKGNIRISFYPPYDDVSLSHFAVDNSLTFDGHFYKAGGSDKGIVDYFKSEKIYLGVYGLKNFSCSTAKSHSLMYYASRLRSTIAENFRDSFSGDTAGVLTALLTGEKDYVSDEIYDNFKNAGIAHLMAVSGMHLGVIALFLNILLSKLRKKHEVIYFLIMVIFVFGMMFIAAFSSSVVRAGTMLIMVLLGRLLNKTSDSLNSLGFACLVILFFNPFDAMSVGFLLSVVSTMSIVVFAAPFSNKYRYRICDLLGFRFSLPYKAVSAVVFCVVVSLCVMVFTLPIMAMYFGRISLVSPVSNLLLLPVTAVIIHMAAVSAVLCAVGFMPEMVVKIVEITIGYCLKVAEITGGTEKFVLKTESLQSIALCCIFPFVCCFAVKGISAVRKKLKSRKYVSR